MDREVCSNNTAARTGGDGGDGAASRVYPVPDLHPPALHCPALPLAGSVQESPRIFDRLDRDRVAPIAKGGLEQSPPRSGVPFPDGSRSSVACIAKDPRSARRLPDTVSASPPDSRSHAPLQPEEVMEAAMLFPVISACRTAAVESSRDWAARAALRPATRASLLAARPLVRCLGR